MLTVFASWQCRLWCKSQPAASSRQQECLVGRQSQPSYLALHAGCKPAPELQSSWTPVMQHVTDLEPRQDAEVLLHVCAQYLVYGSGAQKHPVLPRHLLHTFETQVQFLKGEKASHNMGVTAYECVLSSI